MAKVKAWGGLAIDIDGKQMELGEQGWVPFVLELGEHSLAELIDWDNDPPLLVLNFTFGIGIPAKNLTDKLTDELISEAGIPSE